MITSITINNVATYKTNTIIDELKKVNFFFGFNGSGKSTLAKYLYNLSLEVDKQDVRFNSCSQNGFNSDEHQILVFNEDFTKRNFIESSTLKGIFSLNEKNEEIDTKIKDLENSIKVYSKRIENKQNIIELIEKDKRSKENELLDKCWNERNQFNTFTKLDIGNKTKKSHLSKIRSLIAQLNNISTLEELTDEYQNLYEKDLQLIVQNIDINLYKKIRKIEKKLNTILSEVIVGNEDVDIANLIKQLNSKNWVDEGRKYLEQTGSICPFCQKNTIDDEFKKQLEEIFDESYKEKINLIKILKTDYEKLMNELLNNISQIQQIFNPNNLCFEIYHKLENIKNKNIRVIEEKLSNPNEKKQILSINTLKNDFSSINAEISKNNNLFKDLDKHKQELLNKIWFYIVNKCKSSIENFDNRLNKYDTIKQKANGLIFKYTDKIFNIKNEIEELRKKTINTKEAVENINKILKNSGFDGFEIKEKEVENNISKYYLRRLGLTDNEVFQTLSEGEKNFISFLYFYQLCIGTDDIENNSLKKKIIVIDDPVSSLDSRVLFIISTLIRNLLKPKENNKREFKNENILQMFVLTHNIYFYKEVAYNNGKIIKYQEINHYRISKINNKTHIEKLNKAIFDDYSLMWESLKEIKENFPNDKSMNIFIANTMRRIIESYVNFIGLGNNSWAALIEEDIDEPNYSIKSAFISLINDESHKIGALDNIYYQRIINEEPSILFDVFEDIFNDIGKEHYNLMFGIEGN